MKDKAALKSTECNVIQNPCTFSLTDYLFFSKYALNPPTKENKPKKSTHNTNSLR